MTLDMTTRWNELHAIPKFSPRYPSDLPVRWTFRNFPREKARDFSLLDVGAGGGRHAIFWAREGYRATATDISPLAAAQAIAWAHEESLKLDSLAAQADSLPFADGSFDGLLSFGVIYYLPYCRMKAAISEMQRVLKPGGRALVMIKSDVDARATHGERLDELSYKVAVPDPGAHWKAEAGLVLTLLDKSHVETCFEGFSDVVIDRSSVTACGGLFVDDEWLIQLRK